MKKIVYATVIILAIASCNTPNGVIGNPESTTNTSGTTGSANMTNNNNGTPVVKSTPGTPGDSTVIKKDSLPK